MKHIEGVTEGRTDVEALRADISRLQLALKGAGQGVWDHDIASGKVCYSDTWKTMRGYQPADDVDAIAGAWIERLHPDDKPRIADATQRQDQGELEENCFEYRERHRDGHWIWILSRGRPVEWCSGGRVARIIGTDTDITALKAVENELEGEKERLIVTLKSIAEGFLCLDRLGVITSFNAAAAALTGWPVEDAVGRPVADVLDLRSAADQPITDALIRQALGSEKAETYADEGEIMRRGGERRRVHLSMAPVVIRGDLTGLVVVFRDTTDEHDQKARLQHAAMHDALTGLPNRTVFEAAVDAAVINAGKEKRQHTLCMLDLDRFKMVNDTAGHAAGDQVLKQVAERLASCCRQADVVARLGGDEFGILLTDADETKAQIICGRITKSIADLSFVFGGMEHQVGVSVGYKSITGKEPNSSKLLSLADEACYRAKAAGRGRWVSADNGSFGGYPAAEAHSPAINRDMIASHFVCATNLALVAISGEGQIEFVNSSALKLFGYEDDEMVGAPITIIIPERMRGGHMAGFARVAAGERPNLGGKTVEVSAIRKDGSEFPIEITLSIWKDRGRFFAGAVIKDISERRERDARLLRLASQDTLTGLHNRHRFTDLLKAELSAGRPATVIMIGLDGFKDVNEAHGHMVGDSLLQAIGVRLSYILTAKAEIARFSGDEFAVLLPDLGDPIMAAREASTILEGFASPFDVGGHVLDIGASVGYALAPAHSSDEEELIASADYALSQAKSAGKGTARMFEHSMRGDSAARRAMRDELRNALKHGELIMYFQPQVDLRTSTIFGFESLIRWQHPQRGLLLPGAFLPALDQSALALDIGWWTLDEACRQLAKLEKAGHHLKMGVNLFPAQMRSPSLCRKVAEAIERHGIDPAGLELEVTETIALHDDDKSFETLTALRQMGVGIAFDDFGTGYASLSSLQRYPLTTLKIDKGFVRDILTRPQDAAITRALIAMSSDLGLQTIAEGIETAEQEATLRILGCPAAQGYRYGRPMPASDITALLEKKTAPETQPKRLLGRRVR